jgi:hypothetical protein
MLHSSTFVLTSSAMLDIRLPIAANAASPQLRIELFQGSCSKLGDRNIAKRRINRPSHELALPVER